MSLDSNQKTLIQRIESFRGGAFREGASVLRYLVETVGFGGADATNAVAKADVAGRVVKVPFPLTELRKPAAMKDALGDTPGTSILGVGDAAGSVLTGSTTHGGTTNSATEKASFIHRLGPDYVAGAAVTVRLRAKVSAARQVSATVDMTCKKIADGALGADICATAAQNLTTAYVDYDFTITPTTLAAGDQLQVDITLATDDTGGSSDGAPTISEISVRESIST